MICAGGICVATIALVCTLSVYNGFQQLISGVISSFDPDLKISLVEGKTFDSQIVRERLAAGAPDQYIETTCDVLEENALIRHHEKQTSVTIKGVSANYLQLIPADSITDAGQFILQEGEDIYTVLGAALAIQVEANTGMMSPVTFYVPKYNTKINLANPENSFSVEHLFVSGTYATHQLEIDSKYAFLPIEYTRQLYGYDNVCSSVELKLKAGIDPAKTQREIQSAVGDSFKVENKEEQHEDFYRMMRIEKWITFLILFFILLIAVVNVIGSLSMLIMEKKEDIQTLQNLGATTSFVQQVFLLEGWLISALGAMIGLTIGLLLCFIQEQFGVIQLGSGADEGTFLVNAYPVCVQFSDILLILSTVLLSGWVIAWIPTRYIRSQK